MAFYYKKEVGHTYWLDLQYEVKMVDLEFKYIDEDLKSPLYKKHYIEHSGLI